MPHEYDAVVVGAGPNGLAAATTLADAGASVLVVEAAPTVGGGLRSAELTLPGFVHDVCSTAHPLGLGSPYLRHLPLTDHGLEWVHPEVDLAHPLDGGQAGTLVRSLSDTGAALGDPVGYRRLMGPVVDGWGRLEDQILGPPLRVPRHPLALASFGVRALMPATLVARATLSSERAAALFAGIAAHSFAPLELPLTAAAGLVLGGAAHVVGWPLVRGGSQGLADALASYLVRRGGQIETGRRVARIEDLPSCGVVLFDTDPRQVAAIAKSRLPDRYRARLERFSHTTAAFKVDYALDGPVPWRAEECRRAGTVHLGGTLEEVAAGERDVARGRIPGSPFVLAVQPTLVDPTRAPAGKHVLWTYCHVPNGCTVDMTARIEAQIERFAPGFSDLVLARAVRTPAELEAGNANCVGGDVAGGSTVGLHLVFRPSLKLHPYRTPDPTIFLCSASTPPGAGIHGMCGHWAARDALRVLDGLRRSRAPA